MGVYALMCMYIHAYLLICSFLTSSAYSFVLFLYVGLLQRLFEVVQKLQSDTGRYSRLEGGGGCRGKWTG